eukprot:87358-Hanusia_phi.AAC.1
MYEQSGFTSADMCNPTINRMDRRGGEKEGQGRGSGGIRVLACDREVLVCYPANLVFPTLWSFVVGGVGGVAVAAAVAVAFAVA